ncbi:MAG: metallophosphoesterase [Promethearchaeota archaeon]
MKDGISTTKVFMKKNRLSGKQILLKILLLIIVASPISIFYGLYMTLYLQHPVAKTSWVSWQNDPEKTIYVMWETPDNTSGTLYYGKDPSTLNDKILENASLRFHSLILKNLSPDTKYYYKIVVNDQEYSKGEFRTAPSTFKPFTFAAVGDTQQKFGPGWHWHTAQIFDNKNYSFMTMVGDYVEDGKKAEWNDFFTQASRYLDTIPIIPVRGNHDKPRDLDGDGKVEYYFQEYFPQTEDNVTGDNAYDTEKQFYFSFNWSSVHFQVLHFPEVDIDDKGEENSVNPGDYYKAFTSDQLAWIDQDLKNAESLPFRVTIFHCPITGAGFYGPNFILEQQLAPILLKHNVTATIHGHAHHFERGVFTNETAFPDRSLTYFVVGCGGGLSDVGLRPVKWTKVMSASPCYTEGFATADSLTFTTFSFDGAVIDKVSFNA